MLLSEAKIDILNRGFFLIHLEQYNFWFKIRVDDVVFVESLLEDGETGTAPGMSACLLSQGTKLKRFMHFAAAVQVSIVVEWFLICSPVGL